MKLRLLVVAVLSSIISACTISQTIEPAHIVKEAELCIVENPKVREGFLRELQATLSNRGIAHRTVTPSSIPETCEWTARYTANWTWDMALYMSYAEIKIYHNDKLDGEAIYDSTSGSANMEKFIDAEPKIQELVNKLMQFQSSSTFSKTFS